MAELSPDAGDLPPDGSRIQIITAGELADWIASRPPASCGCEEPQPYNLCCPVVVGRAGHGVRRRR